MKKIKEGGYDEPSVEEVVGDFTVLSDNFLDSIMGLDTKIAQSNQNNKQPIKEKVIV